MRLQSARAGFLAVFASFAIHASPAQVADAKRGKVLYETHCVACHTTQAHWRDGRVVRSWGELVAQVDRWQKNAGNSWRPADVEDVAAYLNGRYYKLPCPAAGCQGIKQARADELR